MNSLHPVRRLLQCGALCLVAAGNLEAANEAPSPGSPRSTGAIAGRILNPLLGEFVRNAEIRVEGTQVAANSSADGSYRLTGVPSGPATVTVTYTGYRPTSASVLVRPGQTATQDFEILTTEGKAGSAETIKMDAFTVSTGREGQAKAIMEQKTAMTATNVVAADSFGSLTEGNAAELLQYLPGVEVNQDGALSQTISIRGMGPDYGGLTIDGMPALTTQHGDNRAPSFVRTNLSAIDLIELNKTVSADMDASAPAGTVNLKSKSAFQRKGRMISWQVFGAASGSDLQLGKSYGAGYKPHYKISPGGSLEYMATLPSQSRSLTLALTRRSSLSSGSDLGWLACRSSAEPMASSFPRTSTLVSPCSPNS